MKIRHPMKLDWGIGKILEVSNNEEIRVFFINVGEKKLMLQYVQPEVIPTAEAAHPLLDNLRLASETDRIKYKSLPQSIDTFLSKYPEGFQGESFMQEERDAKMALHLLGQELLGKSEFTELLEDGNFGEIAARALKMVSKTNLLYPNEKTSLKEGLALPATQEAFAKSLYELLYGEAEISQRFGGFARFLENIDAAKWTTATYFLFIIRPDAFMFVKPTVTQNVAALCGFEINYNVKLNWQTYESVLNFAEYLRNEVAEHEPRDMLDIQAFMWCIVA